MEEELDQSTARTADTNEGAVRPLNEVSPLSERLAALEIALQLEQRIERVEARFGATENKPLPWWEKTGLVATLAAIIAAVAPVTVGVGTWVRTAHEQNINRDNNNRELQKDYLSIAIDKELAPEQGQRVFRFLKAVFKGDEPLHVWAREELAEADAAAELAKTRQDLQEERQERQLLQDTLQERENLIAEMEDNILDLEAKSENLTASSKSIVLAREELEVVRQQLAERNRLLEQQREERRSTIRKLSGVPVGSEIGDGLPEAGNSAIRSVLQGHQCGRVRSDQRQSLVDIVTKECATTLEKTVPVGYIGCIDREGRETADFGPFIVRVRPGRGGLGQSVENATFGTVLCAGDVLLTWQAVSPQVQTLVRTEQGYSLGEAFRIGPFARVTFTADGLTLFSGRVDYFVNADDRRRRVELGPSTESSGAAKFLGESG